MTHYAIVNKETKEFYADPVYEDKGKANDKIKYLVDYQIKNKMKRSNYVIEELTPERLEQHIKEWERFKSMID